jgi:hypothetical protein
MRTVMKQLKRRRGSRLHLGGLLALAVLAQGCASNSMDDLRLARYQPDMTGRTYLAPAPPREDAPPPVDVEVLAVPTEAADGHRGSGNHGERAKRTLKRGDMVVIYLRGIPQPDEIKEIIDDLGNVSLPLVDMVEIDGLSTSKAERKVRDAYVNSGFYMDISITIVAQEDEYFVRGEVKREGRYPLTGEITLLKAITAAGGYTDYAKSSKVVVIRDNEEPLIFDCARIERRRDPDPLINPGDIVVVPRRRFW